MIDQRFGANLIWNYPYPNLNTQVWRLQQGKLMS